MKKAKRLIVFSLILCIIGVVGAGLIQTNFGDVEITDVYLQTDEGTLYGLMLKPSNATSSTPAPAIVCRHGYLNNAEMQDCNYVELARRGYVVISMDGYGHGHSDVASITGTPNEETGGMKPFVEYLASLDFVDETKIGVTGHSMGGAATNATMKYFSQLEEDALKAGKSAQEAHALNLVNTGVIVGNYPTVGFKYNCNVNAIEGVYDEFFFGSSLEMLTSESSRQIVKDQTGITVDKLQEGFFYENPTTGYTVAMFNPKQFHATNHFSPTVVKYIVTAFENGMGAPNPIPANNQTWYLKELFNLIGLIGFFAFVVPFTDVLLNTKYFEELKVETTELLPALDRNGKKQLKKRNFWVCFSNFILTIPFLLIGYVGLLSPLLPQDTTGGIATWCLLGGVICWIATKKGFGQKLKGHWDELHVKIGGKKFWKSLLLSVIVVVTTYLLVFAADYINKTDFRIWSFDIRVFSANKIIVALKYLPFFLVFYFFSALSTSRTTFANWSEKKQIRTAVLVNIMTPALILIVTYVPTIFFQKTLWIELFSHMGDIGAMAASAFALIPILMIPFVPILGIAAVYNVKLYRKTNNVWIPALINAMLITMITIANTSFSFAY